MMNVKNREYNQLYEKILKNIIICSIIQLVCIASTITVGTIQKKHYNNIINYNYETISTINNLNISINQLNKTVCNYADNLNPYEDYSHEIDYLAESITEYITMLEEKMQFFSQKGQDTLCNIILSSEKLISTVNGIKEALDNHEQITTKQIEELINEPINIIGKESDMLLITVYMNKERTQNNIYILSLISIIVNIIAFIAVLTSIRISFILVKKNGQRMVELQEKANQEIRDSRKTAYTDSLTKLWNRKYTEKKVNGFIKSGESGCLFMMDMDNFKLVNDTYGHIAGDNVLKSFANTMKQNARKEDICCRIGGDEFMLFLRGASREKAEVVVKRLLSSAEANLKTVEGGNHVTVSIGISILDDTIKTFKDLYDQADEALYGIKKNGKNGYCFYS